MIFTIGILPTAGPKEAADIRCPVKIFGSKHAKEIADNLFLVVLAPTNQASTTSLSVPAYAFEAYLTPPKTLTAIFKFIQSV